MKLVLVSQRVEVTTATAERRDMLDQRWALLLAKAGYIAMPVPNLLPLTTESFSGLTIAGVVLSGGNDLVAYGGDAPERDAQESALLDLARLYQWPVLGICRGMQLLTHYTRGSLLQIGGHVAVRHQLNFAGQNRSVNSFHRWACLPDLQQWQVTAQSADQSIEAMQHNSLPWCGWMWHPEREAEFHPQDVQFIHDFFSGSDL